MQRKKNWINGGMLGAGVLVCALAAIGAMSGCVSYGSYSPGEGYRGMSWANDSQMSEVTRRAVVAAVARSEVDGPYAVRLPEGMDTTRRERVLSALDDPNARLSSAETVGLPEFMVERVVVRVNNAEVDVSVPVSGLGLTGGAAARQLTTYYLKSGFGRWRVARMRTWSLGVGESVIAGIDQDEGGGGEAVVVEEVDGDGVDEPPF